MHITLMNKKMTCLIDIHSHIIPNVDDGPKSFEESLKMIQKMSDDGIKTVIATPHVQKAVANTTRQFQVDQFYKLKEKAKDIKIDLVLGAEINYNEDINTNFEKYLLGNSNYILMEFPYHRDTPINDIMKGIIEQGFKPIVAHIERYTYLNRVDYNDIINTGALLQVNASSILNERSRFENEAANYLIENKLIDFIGSDAHALNRRPPNLGEAYTYLKNEIDKEYLNLIFYKNALDIID